MCILTPADHNVLCVWWRTLPADQYGIESWGCVSAMQPTPLSLVVRPRLTYEPHELRSHRVAPMTLRGANACMFEPARALWRGLEGGARCIGSCVAEYMQSPCFHGSRT